MNHKSIKEISSQVFFLVLVIFSLILNNSLFAENDRAKRPFQRIKEAKTGLNVPVPARPTWDHIIEPREGTYALIISTPEKFYPQVSLEIILNHRITIELEKLEEVALSAQNAMRIKSGLKDIIQKSDLTFITYGEIKGYEYSYSMESNGRKYSTRSIMGIMSSGHPITIFLVTPEGQIEHIKDISNKILDNIKELP